MKSRRHFFTIFIVFFVTACVTINVYFPAAEAEDAAAEIVNKILGPETETPQSDDASVDDTNPQSYNGFRKKSYQFNPLNWLISSAHAQANINISSPSISEITERMRKRYESQVIKYLDGKVVGFSGQGFLEVIADGSLPLRERQVVKKMVADDNRDRKALYRELAVANGHPEWEQDIQNIFVKQWIGQARKGWMYQNSQNKWVSK